jgi:hypothetical protein
MLLTEQAEDHEGSCVRRICAAKVEPQSQDVVDVQYLATSFIRPDTV